MSEEKKTHPEHKYSVTFVSKVGKKLPDNASFSVLIIWKLMEISKVNVNHPDGLSDFCSSKRITEKLTGLSKHSPFLPTLHTIIFFSESLFFNSRQFFLRVKLSRGTTYCSRNGLNCRRPEARGQVRAAHPLTLWQGVEYPISRWASYSVYSMAKRLMTSINLKVEGACLEYAEGGLWGNLVPVGVIEI